MDKFIEIVDRTLFYLLSLSLGALVVICFVQVTARYIFNSAFTWAEEVSVVILLWSTWVGACLVMTKGSHLKIEFLEDRLPERERRILRLVLDLLVVFFLIYITVASKTAIDAIGSQTLWSLPEVSLKVMYASVPAGCILMLFYQTRLILENVRQLLLILKNDRRKWNSRK